MREIAGEQIQEVDREAMTGKKKKKKGEVRGIQ